MQRTPHTIDTAPPLDAELESTELQSGTKVEKTTNVTEHGSQDTRY